MRLPLCGSMAVVVGRAAPWRPARPGKAGMAGKSFGVLGVGNVQGQQRSAAAHFGHAGQAAGCGLHILVCCLRKGWSAWRSLAHGAGRARPATGSTRRAAPALPGCAPRFLRWYSRARPGRPRTSPCTSAGGSVADDSSTRAQQARPVHQPGERGQVGHVKVVGLVQHQVAGQQAQHGRNLAAAAQAFGGGGEVVDGADQQGRGQQLAHFGVAVTRAAAGAGRCLRMSTVPASSSRLGAMQSRWLRPAASVVLKQRPAGRAADLDGQLLVVSCRSFWNTRPVCSVSVRSPMAKAQRRPAHRVGQRVHDAGIAQRFAAAGGGHVDDEGTVRCAGAHAGGQVGGFVLPGESALCVLRWRSRRWPFMRGRCISKPGRARVASWLCWATPIRCSLRGWSSAPVLRSVLA
jgi:hypothetical protein